MKKTKIKLEDAFFYNKSPKNTFRIKILLKLILRQKIYEIIVKISQLLLIITIKTNNMY